MAESDFSWFKIASFFGAGLLMFIAIVAIASGIYLAFENRGFNGVITIIAGTVCAVLSVLVYKNYEKKSNADRPGVKSK